MIGFKGLTVALGIAAIASAGCAQLSSPPTQREQTAAIGGLAGGASGAIIGAFAGGATAGGLFGIPLGAVAGYYLGDQMANKGRDMEERDMEIDRLRRENERLRQEDRPAPRARLEQSQEPRTAPQAAVQSEQNITSSQQGSSQQAMSESRQSEREMDRSVAMGPARLRQVQQKLNDMGFDAGQVDGIYGPRTQAAIRNFQQAKGLETTGRPDNKTINALGIESSSESQPRQAAEREPNKANVDRSGGTSSTMK